MADYTVREGNVEFQLEEKMTTPNDRKNGVSRLKEYLQKANEVQKKEDKSL